MTSKRVAVTSPQTRIAHAGRRYRGRWRPTTLDPADAKRAVELYRVQRRRAAVAFGLLSALITGLPAVLAALPWLGTVRAWGIPLSWLALGAAPFPAMVLLARWHLRKAERAEAQEDAA